jgi:hypothetical protein
LYKFLCGLFPNVYASKKAPYQIIRPILVGEIVQNKQKKVFFILFRGIWVPPNVPKKVLEGMQVEGKHVPMSKLEKKPLTKSSGPFL